MKKGTVITNFTIGFGNNIFQYCFSRLLAEKHNMNFVHKGIKELEIPANDFNVTGKKVMIVNDDNYK
ncbi:MAG: hypothetical protein CL811_10870, partial [Colwelliaceae bacterium]|nr:hypothetical protein [Colwelliaceae bacterium]